MPNDTLFGIAALAAADISDAKSQDGAAQATIGAVLDLGYFSLSVVERPSAGGEASDAVLFTNVPEAQAEKYRQRGYATVDPIVQRTLRGDGARMLSGIGEERLSALERKVFSSYHCASGVQEGLVIPVRRSVHPAGVVTFGGVEPDQSAQTVAALTVLGHIVYGRLEELRAAPKESAKTGLSRREIEILSWVAKGKSDPDIAIILGISERTARFHMANVKSKLGATTRVQAVAKGLELGLIGR